jgi:hypothetical protein
VLNGNSRGQWQKKITPEPLRGEPPRGGSDPVTGIQLWLAEESGTLVSLWDGVSLESKLQAAGAFDSSVPTEALHVCRNMSTPRPGGLGLVKQAVPLN